MAEKKQRKLIGQCDKGHCDPPKGGGYSSRIAEVYRLASGRYELELVIAHGSNQGYLEEHGRLERRYRAGSLDGLLRVGVAEIRSDAELSEGGAADMGAGTQAQLVAAVREAVFEAEDLVVASLGVSPAETD